MYVSLLICPWMLKDTFGFSFTSPAELGVMELGFDNFFLPALETFLGNYTPVTLHFVYILHVTDNIA